MTSWWQAKFGRVRVSTAVLIVVFVALFWVNQTFEPERAPAPTPAVVPPGFVPDPNYTWVPRTNVQQPTEGVQTTTTPPTTTTSRTTTSPTSPTTDTPTTTVIDPDGPGPLPPTTQTQTQTPTTMTPTTTPAPGLPLPTPTTTAAPPS